MTADDFPYQLTTTITVGIVRNPTPGRLLKVHTKGTEVLGHDEIMGLLGCILYAVRSLSRKKYPNSRKFANMIPSTVWLEPDVKMLMGRLERAFKTGKESLEE